MSGGFVEGKAAYIEAYRQMLMTCAEAFWNNCLQPHIDKREFIERVHHLFVAFIRKQGVWGYGWGEDEGVGDLVSGVTAPRRGQPRDKPI